MEYYLTFILQVLSIVYNVKCFKPNRIITIITTTVTIITTMSSLSYVFQYELTLNFPSKYLARISVYFEEIINDNAGRFNYHTNVDKDDIYAEYKFNCVSNQHYAKLIKDIKTSIQSIVNKPSYKIVFDCYNYKTRLYDNIDTGYPTIPGCVAFLSFEQQEQVYKFIDNYTYLANYLSPYTNTIVKGSKEQFVERLQTFVTNLGKEDDVIEIVITSVEEEASVPEGEEDSDEEDEEEAEDSDEEEEEEDAPKGEEDDEDASKGETEEDDMICEYENLNTIKLRKLDNRLQIRYIMLLGDINKTEQTAALKWLYNNSNTDYNKHGLFTRIEDTRADIKDCIKRLKIINKKYGNKK